MKYHKRYLIKAIEKDLQKKMVFVGGPRQVGKTTLTQHLLGKNQDGYLNWDNVEHREKILKRELPPSKIWIFDEIHKYARWRNLIKGIYDTTRSERKIIVTGSARLDYYRKGGDSLVNRYRHFRLHPLSLCELSSHPTASDLDRLLKFSGFPEPFFEARENEHRIWRRDRVQRVIREDLRDLEYVREISLIEHLVQLIPEKVGAPLSIKSIREDLGVDHKSVERWLQILENIYICFRISPFGSKRIRAVKKEQKVYLWDWTMVEEEGFRLENLIASQLLKYCHFIEDTEGHSMELRFLRDTDKREVDFVVLKNQKPLFAVEAKTGEKNISPAISYFELRTDIPHFYQVHRGTKTYQRGRTTVLPFIKFCEDLKMP